MKHPPWTDAWYPVLNLRFAEPLDWLKAQRGGHRYTKLLKKLRTFNLQHQNFFFEQNAV